MEVPAFASGMDGMGPGDDFLKQIEGTWRQIKLKTEELQRSQAEIARLTALLDKATGDIAASTSREQETRSKLVALTGAIKDRDAKSASLQAAVEQLQAGKAAAEQQAGMLQAQLGDLIERYKHGEAVNISLHERLHLLEHGEDGVEATRTRLNAAIADLTAQLKDEKARVDAVRKEMDDRVQAIDRDKSELNKCVLRCYYSALSPTDTGAYSTPRPRRPSVNAPS
jgi:chromosome segregation ATPase